MALNRIDSGAIIVSASGMCNAGRIRHHLRHRLPRAANTVLFTGYQAIGTTGRRIVDGAKFVRLFGEDVPVRAEVATIGGLSAHAGQSGLLWWLDGFKRPPAQTFVVHGEPQAASSLAARITGRGWTGVTIPRAGEKVSL